MGFYGFKKDGFFVLCISAHDHFPFCVSVLMCKVNLESNIPIQCLRPKTYFIGSISKIQLYILKWQAAGGDAVCNELRWEIVLLGYSVPFLAVSLWHMNTQRNSVLFTCVCVCLHVWCLDMPVCVCIWMFICVYRWSHVFEYTCMWVHIDTWGWHQLSYSAIFLPYSLRQGLSIEPRVY